MLYPTLANIRCRSALLPPPCSKRLARAVVGCVLAVCCLAAGTAGAVELKYYLPEGVRYQSEVSKPSDYLGFEIGERHLQHHELVGYLRHLAAASDRVTWFEYARSYGGRPLILLVITSPQNHDRLEEIRERHLQLTDPNRSRELDLEDLPAVINMGYGVHGDESSASNAAPLVAYHLAAARGREIEQLLDKSIVLLDPSLNPDGFDRFANWANNHRGRILNADRNHREHQQGWPSGRTNYYWFDLNRDWLPAQHPESQGRLEQFHRWMPNVLLDFHEMGTDATYFFQPGVPTRTHPLIPQQTYRLTEAISKYHARALDDIGSLYYTQERYDDFYPGKGSTYPDLHGGIGILFEQASSRGHVQEALVGEITFPFTIRNQFRTSLSSLAATNALRTELLENLRTFYRESLELARHADVQGYLFTAPADAARLFEFAQILARHQIEAYQLARDTTVDGRRFTAEHTLVVPVRQPQYRFLQALVERRTDFEENIFYDISAWTLPAAFNLEVAELSESPPEAWLGSPMAEQKFPRQKLQATDEDLAYVLDYRGYYAPRAVYRLLDAEIHVKVAQEPFSLGVGDSQRHFDRGAILVPIGVQPENRARIVELVRRAAADDGVSVVATGTALTPRGVDLGSGSFQKLRRPKVLLAVGSGVSPSEAGEIWHLLDQRFDMPVTLVDVERFSGLRLNDYTHVVLPSGSYSSWGESMADRLRGWLRDGGTLVAIGSAVRWLDSRKLVSVRHRAGGDDAKESATDEPTRDRRPYAEAETERALQLLSGAIFRTHVDPTHPLGYGYTDDTLYVFRNQRIFLEPAANVYSTPVAYPSAESAGQTAGYISASNRNRLADSASVLVQQVGSGRVVVMVDNPNFRAFWYGTNRLFLNALLFGPVVREPAGE